MGPIPLTYKDDDSAQFEEAIQLQMRLHSDHEKRPLWVCPDGRIFFAASIFPELVGPISEFLVSVADPVSRPRHIHVYQLSVYSIYAAVALGMTIDEILAALTRFAKNELDSTLLEFLVSHGGLLGKAKLALVDRRYFIETQVRELFASIEKHPTIQACRIQAQGHGQIRQIDGLKDDGVLRLEIDKLQIERVKECAYRELSMPLLEEYEFRSNDGRDRPVGYEGENDDLPILIRPTTNLRPYQQKCLAKIFSDRRARSGIVVLPCGAGKTLVGISAVATLKKRALVLTTTAVAVDQWKRQFEQYTSIDPDDVILLTADSKSPIPRDRPVVLISTYSMFAHAAELLSEAALEQSRQDTSKKPSVSRATQMVLSTVKELEWGMLVVDEVQVMPARTFRTVATTVHCHSKLGLTATLVREDDLIEDLQYLIGPKLYEANWQDLEDCGFIAKVHCVEVWCDMPPMFWMAYLQPDVARMAASGLSVPAFTGTASGLKRALYTCNPTKLVTCEMIMRVHEMRGDRILVFCDRVGLLVDLARKSKRPYICGSVPMHERMAIIKAFQNPHSHVSTIFISQVGDNAIDLPNANVVIQISSQFGSRRQEAQRLGRILRPKQVRDSDGNNAYFYSLVTCDTPEREYAERRQRFLVDQGYSYSIVRDMQARLRPLLGPEFKSEFSDPDVQAELLRKCTQSDDLKAVEKEDDEFRLADPKISVSDQDAASVEASVVRAEQAVPKATLRSVNLADLSSASSSILLGSMRSTNKR